MEHIDKFNKMDAGFDMTRAMNEADRCLLCHDAPCSEACPANTDPGSFIRKLRLKNISGAIRTIKSNNILGGACGVLCPTAELCEKACSARMKSDDNPKGSDRPISIGEIQRFLVEHAWRTGFKVFQKPTLSKEKVAVVGSGPAGLSCAAELAKVGHPVTIFEARPEPGGVLRYGVVAYRFDLNFLEKELADIRELGVEFKCDSPIGAKFNAEDLLRKGYQAVFLGPGLWSAHSLNKDSNSITGLYTSVEYLLALRDGRLEAMAETVKGKTVAVIGGGSVAMDCVVSVVKLGAKDVYLIYRRSYGQMPAEAHERIEALEAGVHYLLLNQPVDYLTSNQRQITGVELMRCRLGEPDESRRRRPVMIEGSQWIIDVDLVIEAIGNRAVENSDKWYPGVTVDDGMLIKADPETGRTSVPGIFAGGDIVRGPALVVQAVEDGKVAAKAISQYLETRRAEND